jgi:hypothetical protein
MAAAGTGRFIKNIILATMMIPGKKVAGHLF